jgi:cytochrome o ubiquinol oxidase subunit 2
MDSALRRLRIAALLPLAAALGGCDFVVLNPSGDIAVQQRDLVVISTVLMLLIIIPVIVLTLLFAWRYRQSNTAARYEPDWDHSTHLELVIWAVPLLIIICLGAVTWMGTHLLDPYRAVDRVAEGQPVQRDAAPLEVDVVALDWKWLFIYPEFGMATVNQLAAPVDRPIRFHITASSVMNSFYIPALAGQIYAMPGMETRLNAVINHAGVYQGFSANYSGAGFSGMRFTFHALDRDGFERWVAEVRQSRNALDRDKYLELERPSENEPVRRYATVAPDLFDAVLNRCVEPGRMCAKEMAAIDAKGGLGLAGARNLLPWPYETPAGRGTAAAIPARAAAGYVGSVCTTADAGSDIDALSRGAPAVDASPTLGAGLPRPPSMSSWFQPALQPAVRGASSS